jgi:AcrR family transcriptional regulator
MNHVMTTQDVTASASLQDEHIAVTRKRILDAVVELIVEEHPAALSIPAVAARAGVSVRTIYRHFPNKEALLDAVAEIGDEQTQAGFPDDEVRLDNLHVYLPQAWGELVQTRALVQAQNATPLGHELQRSRAVRRRKIIEQVLAQDNDVELAQDDHRRLVAMITHLVSRDTLFDLTDLLGLSVEEAAALTVWTVRAAVDAARRTKEVGR